MRFLEAQNVSLADIVEDKLSDLLCAAHGNIDLMFGTSSTLTEETLGDLLSGIFGCDVTVGEGFDLAKSRYGNEGNGNTAGGPIELTFSGGAERYVTNVDFAISKHLYAQYSGAMENGYLSFCWDDVPDEVKAAKAAIEEYDQTVMTLSAENTNVGYLENYFRQVTGLNDPELYTFHTNGISDGSVVVCFLYVNGEGRAYSVGASLTIETEG